MTTVTFEIYLQKEDKEKPEVISILERESGNTKEEIVAYLETHDVVKVPEMPLAKAEQLYSQFSQMGIITEIKDRREMSDEASIQEEVAEEVADDFVRTWNWWAFIFTYLWYLVKGLWAKVIVYSMLQWAVGKLPLPAILQLIYPLAFWIYIGMYANYDLYLKEVRDERLWLKLPWKKWKKAFWACFILFIVLAMVMPATRTVQFGVSSFQSIMEQGQGSGPSQVVISDGINFTAAPDTWWKSTKPVPGTSMKASRQVGTGEHKLEYTASKHTKMTAVMMTAALFSGEANESLGVMAVELYKPGLFKKYPSVDDPKVVDEIMSQSTLKLPMFFGWVKKFFKVTAGEPEYQMMGQQRWGRCVVIKEIEIVGQKFESLADVYWTIVNGKLLVVLSDYFPEFRGKVRDQIEGFIHSMVVEGGLSVNEGALKGEGIELSSSDRYTVRDLVAAGEAYIEQGDLEKAELSLQKAIDKVRTEDDLREIERLRRKLNY